MDLLRQHQPIWCVGGDLSAHLSGVAPLNPLPCPVTIAWSENDAVIPVPACDKIARERVPQASFTILPGVGHDPMIDDPDLAARTILAVTGRGMSHASFAAAVMIGRDSR